MPTVRQNKHFVRLVSFGLTLVIGIGLFFIPIGHSQNVTVASSDTQTGQTFFILERYNIIREIPVRAVSRNQRSQDRMVKPAESIPRNENAADKTEHIENVTEHSEQIKSEPEHSQNETAEQETPQNETAKPSGSIFSKKSTKNVIEYTPNFTIDKMPVYPMSARRLGQQGTVGITAYIDGIGKVLNVVAAKSSGVKSLDDAAVAAVRCWSFGSLHLTDKMNIVRTEIVFKLE